MQEPVIAPAQLSTLQLSGGQHILEGDIFPIGSRIRVANDSPLRGLKGTIIAINVIATPGEPTFCFYKIALDNTQLHEPLWFEYHEVELVEASCEQPAECWPL